MVIRNLAAVSEPGQHATLLDPVAFAPSGQTRDDWLALQNLDQARRWLAVLGEVSERKCIGMILDALATDTADQAGWGLVVIGKPSNPVLRDRLTAASRLYPDRIVFNDSFISDIEFDTWVSVADLVSVLYRNEGSSGVLLKCWAAGARVVVGGSDSVLAAAESLGMQYVVVDDLSPDGIREAILGVHDALRAAAPDSTEWQQRSDSFAKVLLGLD